MPSNYTPRSRLNLQATGENINLWGQILNGGGLELIDAAMDGVTTISASGPTTLTTANGAADQARSRVLNVTAASAAQITIPSVEKFYIVRAALADVTITNGSNSLVVKAGDTAAIITDGVAIWLVRSTDLGAARLKNVGAPQLAGDAATKGYVDGLAFSSALPDQVGNEGRWITTDGVGAVWSDLPAPTPEQVTDALGFTPEDAASKGQADGYAGLDSGGEVPMAQLNTASVGEFQAGSAEKLVRVDDAAEGLAFATITRAAAASGMAFDGFINAAITLDANLTLGAPSGGYPEKTGRLRFVQDATGGWTFAAHANYILPAGFALQASANGVTEVPYTREADGKVRFFLPSKWVA